VIISQNKAGQLRDSLGCLVSTKMTCRWDGVGQTSTTSSKIVLVKPVVQQFLQAVA